MAFYECKAHFFFCWYSAWVKINVKVEDDILIQSYRGHVKICDSSLLKVCYQELENSAECFSPTSLSDLVTTLSKYSCRQMPLPLNFKSILADLARNKFLVKPLSSALHSLNSGIPDIHCKFWSDVTIEVLCTPPPQKRLKR